MKCCSCLEWGDCLWHCLCNLLSLPHVTAHTGRTLEEYIYFYCSVRDPGVHMVHSWLTLVSNPWPSTLSSCSLLIAPLPPLSVRWAGFLTSSHGPRGSILFFFWEHWLSANRSNCWHWSHLISGYWHVPSAFYRKIPDCWHFCKLCPWSNHTPWAFLFSTPPPVSLLWSVCGWGSHDYLLNKLSCSCSLRIYFLSTFFDPESQSWGQGKFVTVCGIEQTLGSWPKGRFWPLQSRRSAVVDPLQYLFLLLCCVEHCLKPRFWWTFELFSASGFPHLGRKVWATHVARLEREVGSGLLFKTKAVPPTFVSIRDRKLSSSRLEQVMAKTEQDGEMENTFQFLLTCSLESLLFSVWFEGQRCE